MLDSARMPWPTPWQEVFGRSAPLLVEIGFGGGHFLVDLARQLPESNVLGIEISAPSLRRAARKVEKAGLANVRVMKGDAGMILRALCLPASIEEVYINFPDPWPKASHQRRRLINRPFLELLASRMRTGGVLEIATDHPEYSAVIADCLTTSPYFTSQLATAYVTDAERSLQTKYELTALREGRTCHYFKWQRNASRTRRQYPVPKELPMPHVVLRSTLSLADIGRQFQPIEGSEGETHIKLMGLYQSMNDQRLLVETYVNEEALRQRIGLSIRQKSSGALVVGLHEIGFPRSTEGVHLAIKTLADWMIGLAPGSEVVHSNVSAAVIPGK